MAYEGHTNIWWRSAILNEYADLMVEYQATGVKEVMDEIDTQLENAIQKLLALPQNAALRKNEPDDLEEIRALRPEGKRQFADGLPAGYEDRLAGAFLGRLAGCLLGSIVEGYPIEDMQRLAKANGDTFPPVDYWTKAPGTPGSLRYWKSPIEDYTRGQMAFVPVDDDIMYTLEGLLIVEEYGQDFTTVDVGESWLKYIPYGYTAEEAALRTVMYLINAISFDAEWETVYLKENVREVDFHAANGQTQVVEMMSSMESQYIRTEKGAGFLKRYKNGGYALAALLPDEEVGIEDYIASLAGDAFLAAVRGAEPAGAQAAMPKFQNEYKAVLNDDLIAMGMPAPFDSEAADFSGISPVEDGNRLWIGEVLHKTHIAVDEQGTRAGAATAVSISAGSPAGVDPYTVTLDRPFVYAIVDTATGLPLFIGTVMEVAQ